MPFPVQLQWAPAGRELPGGPAAQRIAGCQLLLDDELDQEIAITIPEEAGCTVDVASDGAEAVEEVRDSAADPYGLIPYGHPDARDGQP